MTKIGITGGIGTGKTYVSRILEQEYHIPVYNCDRAARQLMHADPRLREALLALVGPSLYREDGTMDKAVMGAYLFASTAHASQVNALVHPAVRRDFRAWASRQHTAVVALESAILYESGFDAEVDRVIVVEASEETRIGRVTRRDALTPDQVRSRMAHQLPPEVLAQRALAVVHNESDTTQQDIIEQLKTIITLC